jgi:imidazole glycerol phosphate synthase subunit HisF
MPHVVLENINSASVAFDCVVPFTTRSDGGVLKVTDKYLNAGQNKALIESLAVENGNNQSFFVELSQKQTSLTIRLLPLTDPEKTLGVKMIMATVAKQIKDFNPNVSYGKTNLQDFLLE